MSGYKNIFNKNPENYLYPFFWQHGESHDVLEEYVDKINDSGMKALCVEARPHPDFVGDKWWSDMDCIIRKVKENNMKMWILDDSHFPTGYANGRIAKDYPEYLKLYINVRRFDVQGPFKNARIDFKQLKGRPFGPSAKQDFNPLGVYMAKRTSQETVENDPIDASSLVDITSQMRMSDRLLTLDIPDGAYSIFVVFETHKGDEETTKDYLNPLVKEATQVLIDEVYEPHYAHYKDEFGKTIQGFFSDEPRFGNAKGTECAIGKDMPLPWRKGLEKELGFDQKYLPLLWHVASGEEAQIRVQYMDLITKLYNENFTQVLGDWCRNYGVWYLGHTIEDNGAHARLGYGTGHYFRGQEGMSFAGIDVIGGQIVPGQNYHHDAFSTGGSNGEFYHYALAKLGSSAAHLDAKKEGRVMCEAFGAYGWNEGLRTMKWIADSIMVRGVNYIVPHAFDPKEFPDWDCPPHFYAHGHNPQFRYFPTLDNYLNRVLSIFRDGKQIASVGVFYPAETEWAGKYMPIEKVCRKLCENQISFDIISRDFLHKTIVENGTYTINGNIYTTLVFPYGKHIPNDLVPVLYEMVQNHIQVIFINEMVEIVLGEYDQEKWNEVIHHAKVISLSDLGKELIDLKPIQADYDQDLVIQEYQKDEKKIYMFFNENIGRTIHMPITFKESGNVYRYDAMRDEVYYSSTNTELTLSPYQSMIYILTEEVIEAKEETTLKNAKNIELPKKWTVKFADSQTYPEFNEVVPTEELSYIHTLEGYDNKTGTVQYTASMNLKKAPTILDLGKAHETVQVFVNKQLVGTRICAPYTFDLTNYLVEGENEIQIEVTNTLGTQMRDFFGHYLILEPFGIEGSVALIQGD